MSCSLLIVNISCFLVCYDSEHNVVYGFGLLDIEHKQLCYVTLFLGTCDRHSYFLTCYIEAKWLGDWANTEHAQK